MDHDGVFTAEDNLKTAETAVRGRRHEGENALTAAEGGVPNRHYEDSIADSEDTPLIRREGRSRSPPSKDPTWDGGSEWAGLPWHKRPSVYWLLIPFIFSMLAFGGIIVPKVNLILTLICREYYSDKQSANPELILAPKWGADNPQCRIPEVQKYVARFTMYGGLISGILSAIIAPKLGALSDRYGRRKIMMITNAGTLSGEIITIFAGTYPDTFNVNWILLGFVFDGLCGSFIASMAISHSYATDCTEPSRRNVVFGYFHGCLFTGIAIGPLLAGYIIKWTGTVITMFYIAISFHILFILMLVFFIPESLSKKRQHAAQEKHRIKQEEWAASLAARGSNGGAKEWLTSLRSFNLFEPLKILYPKGEGYTPAVRRNLLLLASVDSIIWGVAMGAGTIIIIYANYMFAWDAYYQSIFMSVVNSCRVTVLVIALPLVTRLVRGPSSKRNPADNASGSDLFELSVIRLGIFMDMLGFLGYTLARRGELFIAAGALASAGGIGSPTLQAALTKCVRPDEVGQLLGALGLLHSFARIISPLVFNGIYAATVGRHTQAVFIVLTSMFGLAFCVTWFIRPNGKYKENDIYNWTLG